MTNIILCGGNGTRLWPISRTLMPKQFVKLMTKDVYLQEGGYKTLSYFE